MKFFDLFHIWIKLYTTKLADYLQSEICTLGAAHRGGGISWTETI